MILNQGTHSWKESKLEVLSSNFVHILSQDIGDDNCLLSARNLDTYCHCPEGQISLIIGC